MIFSSPIFLFFFVFYYTLHLALPKNWKLLLLIVGSTLFYGYWDPAYTWVPYLLITVAYLGALWVEKGNISPAARKLKTCIVIIALTLPLIIFKYAHFLYQNFFDNTAQVLNLSLPLGISFITFSLIAYVVEVYKRKFPLEKNLTQFTAYTLFFPHLIAGPILRPNELLPQLNKLEQSIQKQHVIFGLTLFSIGLLKKLVFADPIAVMVDAVYNPSTIVVLNAWDYWLAIYGFSIQIYCDFSGYTDMALGIAMFLGITLPNNFDRPYLANSMVDFWRRWHITLSHWLRDYIYIPLGGNRNGFGYQIRNVLITMILGGLWHGANWTFVLWGLGHGVLISLNHMLKSLFITMSSSSSSILSPILSPIAFCIKKAPNILKILVTFNLVTFLWILFRAPDFSGFCRVIEGPFIHGYSGGIPFLQKNIFPVLLIALFFIFQKFDDHRWIYNFAKEKAKGVFWPFIIFIWVAAITISMGSSAKFVYFDF